MNVVGKTFLKTITIALVDKAAPTTPAIPNKSGRIKQVYAVRTAKANDPKKPTTTVSKFTSIAPEIKLTKNKRIKSNPDRRGLVYKDCNKIEATATAQPTMTMISLNSIFKCSHLAKRRD